MGRCAQVGDDVGSRVVAARLYAVDRQLCSACGLSLFSDELGVRICTGSAVRRGDLVRVCERVGTRQ